MSFSEGFRNLETMIVKHYGCRVNFKGGQLQPQSLSCLCFAVVLQRLPPILVLHLLGCGYSQISPGLGLAYAGLWLCTYFPKSWCCLSWAVVVQILPQVMVLPLLGCGCGQAFASPVFSFARLWLCTGLPRHWSCLCWAVVVLGVPSVLAWSLVGYDYAQASWVLVLCLMRCGCAHCSGFFRSWSCLFETVVMHRLPQSWFCLCVVGRASCVG